MFKEPLLGIVLIAVLRTTSVQGSCQDGWTTFESSCYQFGHEAATFTEAEHYCKQHGAHLVHVNSHDETMFLKAFLMELKRPKHWIGLTDRDIEGVWKWVDDNETAVYKNWHRGEPNQGNDVNCVAVRADYQYQWTDDPCYEHYYPICEQMTGNGEIIG